MRSWGLEGGCKELEGWKGGVGRVEEREGIGGGIRNLPVALFHS